MHKSDSSEYPWWIWWEKLPFDDQSFKRFENCHFVKNEDQRGRNLENLGGGGRNLKRPV